MPFVKLADLCRRCRRRIANRPKRKTGPKPMDKSGILQALQAGDCTQAEIARRFGVCTRTVERVKKGMRHGT